MEATEKLKQVPNMRLLDAFASRADMFKFLTTVPVRYRDILGATVPGRLQSNN